MGILPLFFDENEASDSEEATSPRGSEYSFSLLFRGESASEPRDAGRAVAGLSRSPTTSSAAPDQRPAATPRRSLFASDAEAKEPAAKPLVRDVDRTTKRPAAQALKSTVNAKRS